MITPTNEAGHGLPELPEPFRHPNGQIVGPCVCGSWPGSDCLRCPVINFYTAEQMRQYASAALALSRGVPEIGSWIEADGPLAAALDTPAAAGAQGETYLCKRHGSRYVAGCSDCADDLEMLAAAPVASDPVADLREKWATRSGSLTYDLAAVELDAALEQAMAQHQAPQPAAAAGAQGEDRWELAMRVREALDRVSCPDHFMRVAVETITDTTPQPAAADGGVRELPSVAAFASAMWRDWMTNEQADKLGAELHAWLSAHFATALSSHRQAGECEISGIIEGQFNDDGDLANRVDWRVFRDDDGYIWLTTDDPAKDHLLYLDDESAAPPPGPDLSKFRELAERWEHQAQLHGVRTFTGNDHLIFANELRAALVEKGAG